MTRETIQLQYPVTVKGEEHTAFHLRRPKMRDMKKQQQQKDDLEKAICLISDLAEVPREVVEELDTTDFSTLSDWVGKCMPGAEGTTP